MSFSKVSKQACIYVIASLLCPISNAMALSGSSAPSVPTNYAQEYSALNQAVGVFQASLDNRNQSKASTTMASKLMSADASNGPGLLQASVLKAVAKEVAQYKSMGIQGVVVHASFPIMTQEFFNSNYGSNAGSCKQYIAFYTQVFQIIHAAGMKVLVESHPDFPYGGNNFSVTVQQYCNSLSSKQYQAQYVENNANIATCGPDIISIVSEPNTDYAWTNQQVYKSASTLQQFVQATASGIKAANPKVETAAGSPNWNSDSTQINALFCQIAQLDAIDIHIYFSGNSELEYATSLADSAKSSGKRIVVSEAWLTKAGQGTPPTTSLTGNQQANTAMALATFSFWQPLDIAFIYSFFKWCNVENPDFFTFFYTQQLFANLDYSQYGSLPLETINQDEQQLARQNLMAGSLTQVGSYYASLLNAPRQNKY